MDNLQSLTIVSPTELEFTAGGPIYLCAYTKQSDGLRAVLAAEGKVFYFRYDSNGFISPDGATLLPEREQRQWRARFAPPSKKSIQEELLERPPPPK